MSFSGRDLRHFPEAGVTLGVDVSNQFARVAFCVTNFKHGDKFSRPTARQLINLHFDADDNTLKSMNIVRRTFSFPYEGEKPRTEIIGPMTKRMSEELELRAKTSGRAGSITTIREAIENEVSDLRTLFRSKKKV
jgi:hypothetical protein